MLCLECYAPKAGEANGLFRANIWIELLNKQGTSTTQAASLVDIENEGRPFLRNVGELLSNYMVSLPRRQWPL